MTLNTKRDNPHAPAVAVDFDGTLCTNNWPNIGQPNELAIEHLKNRQENGWKLILWTCRAGEALDAAVNWCAEHGLHFDAVNENLPERIEYFGGDCRKISADEYWDDRALHISAEVMI